MVGSAGPWRDLGQLADSAATRFTETVAVIDSDVTLSYGELVERADGFAAALVADGVGVGDRVAIWLPNSLEWIVAVLGIHRSGATLIPVNTRFKGREAADVLARGRVRLLVTSTDFLGNDYVEMLAGTGVSLPELRTIVVARGSTHEGAVAWTEFIDRPGTEHAAEVRLRRRTLNENSPADILFTSGTTGSPKGVLSTHRQSMAVATDWVEMTGLRAGDRYLMVNPYFHMFGLKAGILACLTAGATMVPMATLDVDRVYELVSDLGVTVLPGPPTLYQMILDHPDREPDDLSTLRVAVTGAADIPIELIRRIYAELPFRVVVSGYGMTEAGTVSSTRHDDSPEVIATTVGRPRPGFEVRITDADDREVAAGTVGEIVARGPSVMSEYVDDPLATAAALPGDGWLHTGDLGRVDERGRLRIVGRTKEMFIVGGFNAYPAEIEAIMLHHPGVRAAGVVGVPDDRLGEVAMAFVEADPDTTPADVIAWCRENMANYKVPRHVRLVEALPLNASGKVHKTQLLEWAAAGPSDVG